MRSLPAVVLALLVVAGGVAPVVAASAASPAVSETSAGPHATADGAPSTSDDAASTDDEPTTAADAASFETTESPPPDPEEDVIGWENGYWYNESIDVDQSDGLSDEEREALVSRTMARVEHIRQLEFQADVPIAVKSREELRQQLANRSTNETLRTFDNAKFEAMFLINETTDSIAVQDSNSGASILGFYSSRNDQIVLVAPNESAARIDELTLAHELVHALQDQHFNLSKPKFTGETRDEVNAIDGVVEGDASFVEHKYSQRCGGGGAWNGTCAQPEDGAGSGGGSLANIGVYFVKFQPYSDGPNFVGAIYQRGGWAAVNALYDDLPESAEQVMIPGAYPDDEPVNVTLTDRTTDEWERVQPPGRPDYGEVGMSGIASMLVFPLYESQGQVRTVEPRAWLNYTEGGDISSYDPLNYAFDAAAGWEGDRMHVYQNDANETAYVWRIVWDSPDEAEEFLATYRQVLEYWGAEEVAPNTYRIEEGNGFADAFYVDVDGDTVTIVNAPAREQLSTVRTSLGQDGTPADGTDDGTSTAAQDDTEPGTPTTSTDGPGLDVGIALVALAAAALLLRRR